jgi:hypothetical protein
MNLEMGKVCFLCIKEQNKSQIRTLRTELCIKSRTSDQLFDFRKFNQILAGPKFKNNLKNHN